MDGTSSLFLASPQPYLAHEKSKWSLYDELIEGIPLDAKVIRCLVGVNWTALESSYGIGSAMTVRGCGVNSLSQTLATKSLRDVAALVKSWNFLEACVGVAALNSYYTTAQRAQEMGALCDTQDKAEIFTVAKQTIPQGSKVCVVGHFPAIERYSDIWDLTILEREPSGDDLPDPACEYVIPEQDYLFLTGITITNKTAPRLLELAQNAHVTFVGPSVILSDIFARYGVNVIAGSVVTDAEQIFTNIAHAKPRLFDSGITMMYADLSSRNARETVSR